MSFSGKKFRRVGCQNIDKLIRDTNANENVIKMLKCNAPIFSFTRIDEQVFRFTLHVKDKELSHLFTLGEEYEMEKRDGSKVKIKYTLEGDNVLKQDIKQPDGKTSQFRREFGENDAKMLITIGGSDVRATVFFEVVQCEVDSNI